MAIVQLDRLTKHYEKNRGITDISFSIEEGEIFGFIGPNGAGKSTTIRTILNFIFPTRGSAKIFGKDCVKHSKEIRKHIGYMPSEVHYYDDMKVVDLLRYSAAFYGYHNATRLEQLAKRLDLDLKRKIEDLSYGNRKKVAIVQALLHEPKLLIMDEPTGGLDPLMQHVFFELLEEERGKGVTIFFSSHILSEVQRLCDRVAIIRDGKLVQVDSIEHITKRSLKKITIRFDKAPEGIENLSGIVRQHVQGQELKLLFEGDIRKILDLLQKIDFVDLSIEEPALEEVFMHYYE